MLRLALTLQILLVAASSFAASPPNNAKSPSSALVIGFVGGFVHADDMRHSEIQLAHKLQASYGNEVTVRIFENRHRADAREMVLDWIKSSRNASLSQLHGDRRSLILYGHSWGASAVVWLARELEKDAVPISLTIQVDSIERHGEDDSLIPANVAEAINFYQPKGLLHGRTAISATDPARTHILGNFQFTYSREPAECRAYPWYNRFFFPGHTSIECDPQLWSHIESMIKMRLPSATLTPEGTATAMSQGIVSTISKPIGAESGHR